MLKKMAAAFFDSIIMLKCGKTKEAKEEFYGAKNQWTYDVDVGKIVISKLTEMNNISKYLIGYLDDVIRSLVLVLPKMSGYVKAMKDKTR